MRLGQSAGHTDNFPFHSPTDKLYSGLRSRVLCNPLLITSADLRFPCETGTFVFDMYSGTTKTKPTYGSLGHQQLPPPRRPPGAPAGVPERRPVLDYYQDLNDSDDDSDDSENFRRRRVYVSSDDEEDKQPPSPRRRHKPTARVPALTPADLRISPAMKAEMESEQKRSSSKRTFRNHTIEPFTGERRPSSALPYSHTPSTEARDSAKTRAKPKPPSRRNTAEKVTDYAGGSVPNVSMGSQSFMKEVTRNVLGERFPRRSSLSGSTRSGSHGKSVGG
jgi:hypothetical protein